MEEMKKKPISKVVTIYKCSKCATRHNGTRPKREQKCVFCKAPLEVEDEWGADGYYDCDDKKTWKSSRKYIVSKQNKERKVA